MLRTSWCLVVVHPSFWCMKSRFLFNKWVCSKIGHLPPYRTAIKKGDTYDDAFDFGLISRQAHISNVTKLFFLGGWLSPSWEWQALPGWIQVLIKSALGTLWNNGCFLCRRCVFLIIIITLYDDIISIHLDLYHIISFHFIWSHIILSYHIITCHIISVCSTLAPLLQASSYTMVLCSFPVHCHWVFRNNIYI